MGAPRSTLMPLLRSIRTDKHVALNRLDAALEGMEQRNNSNYVYVDYDKHRLR